MTDEFLAAVERQRYLAATLGPDHPDVVLAMGEVLEHAPEELLNTIRAKAREMGLLPEPDGYLEDGRPVYSTQAVADTLGVPVQQVEEGLATLIAHRADLGIDTDRIHRKQ